MANKVRSKPVEETAELTPEGKEVLDRIQIGYEKNKKIINIVIVGVIAVVAGYFGYNKMYLEPRNDKASAMMYYANKYFSMDSLDRSLNGDGQHAGFLKVIKKYGGTSAGNMATYYAGVAYLRKGDYKNAIKYLEDFKGKGTLVAYSAYGALADAYMGAGKTKEAAEYYEKAASKSDNTVHNPIYLYRAGLAYEKLNKPEDAKKVFKKVLDNYPNSGERAKIEMMLARQGELAD